MLYVSKTWFRPVNHFDESTSAKMSNNMMIKTGIYTKNMLKFYFSVHNESKIVFQKSDVIVAFTINVSEIRDK